MNLPVKLLWLKSTTLMLTTPARDGRVPASYAAVCCQLLYKLSCMIASVCVAYHVPGHIEAEEGSEAWKLKCRGIDSTYGHRCV